MRPTLSPRRYISWSYCTITAPKVSMACPDRSYTVDCCMMFPKLPSRTSRRHCHRPLTWIAPPPPFKSSCDPSIPTHLRCLSCEPRTRCSLLGRTQDFWNRLRSWNFFHRASGAACSFPHTPTACARFRDSSAHRSMSDWTSERRASSSMGYRSRRSVICRRVHMSSEHRYECLRAGDPEGRGTAHRLGDSSEIIV